MSTRKLIHAEKTDGKRSERQGGIMEKLLEIRIEGPEDFSRNVDAYLNGERPLADGEDPR